MSKPYFWATPFRYMRWASHERPAIFFALILGSLGPVALVGLPPLRRYLGDVDPPAVPMSYPNHTANRNQFSNRTVPPGPRQFPKGFEDK